LVLPVFQLSHVQTLFVDFAQVFPFRPLTPFIFAFSVVFFSSFFLNVPPIRLLRVFLFSSGDIICLDSALPQLRRGHTRIRRRDGLLFWKESEPNFTDFFGSSFLSDPLHLLTNLGDQTHPPLHKISPFRSFPSPVVFLSVLLTVLFRNPFPLMVVPPRTFVPFHKVSIFLCPSFVATFYIGPCAPYSCLDRTSVFSHFACTPFFPLLVSRAMRRIPSVPKWPPIQADRTYSLFPPPIFRISFSHRSL